MNHHQIRVVIYCVLAVNVLLGIALIGHKREPYTPGLAVLNVITAFLFAWAVYSL